MKINRTSRGGNVGSVRQSRTPNVPAAPAGSPGESASLSSRSVQLHALEQSIADTPEIDTARVEAIKQAITEGRFTIDADAVADRLMSAARDMLKSRPR